MTTLENPVVNTATSALPDGLEEIIYASVEKALAALLPHRRRPNRRDSKSKSRSGSRSKSRSRSRGGRSRSHSRGKHGHVKRHHIGFLQSESEEEPQQMEFKERKGHHGMRHGHHGMRHGHHGMRHGHHGMRHGHHGKRHGHKGIRHFGRFPFLACGSRPGEQQKHGEEEAVEVIDLVAGEEGPSVEKDLQKGLENMNVGDNVSVSGSDKQ